MEAAIRERLTAVEGRHSAEMDDLRQQLIDLEAKIERTKSLAQQTRKGHVYVISNLGSFGDQVFKIGMTRRRDPQDRVIELGDASVPFTFDVHMMISCDDAPKLEADLHRKFHRKRVNKANLRKEFFRVGIDEVVAEVERLHGKVEYTADAEASDFLRSQRMTVEEMDAREEIHEVVEDVLPDEVEHE